MEVKQDHWRVCSSCKKPLAYKSKYYECSVSTCSRKRTGYVFCSVICWESHVPGANHRNAGAIEKMAPTYEQWKAENAELESSPPSEEASVGQRRIIPNQSSSTPMASTSAMSQEVLVVVSKMKQYIKDRADMNTSGDVSDVISDLIRRACDEAIGQARADGRKTVMARDFKK